jgi:hypothetical protein
MVGPIAEVFPEPSSLKQSTTGFPVVYRVTDKLVTAVGPVLVVIKTPQEALVAKGADHLLDLVIVQAFLPLLANSIVPYW